MRISVPQNLKFRVVNLIEGKPSKMRAGLIRGSVAATMILMAVPLKVVKEIVYGSPQKKADLKSSFRSMLWLWNRSWIPVKHHLDTYFDIGWNLSAKSCQALLQKGFTSSEPIKHKCDCAQLKLSVIKECVQSGDGSELMRVDDELTSLVNRVLSDSYQWAISPDRVEIEPKQGVSVESVKMNKPGNDFNDDSARQVLLDFDNLCRMLGQEYFLVSGTFLGVVRDSAFIGHDHDIDVGIKEDKILENLLPALQESNEFVVNKVDFICARKPGEKGVRYYFMEKPAIIRLLHNTGIAIDIFVHFYDADVLWHGSSIHRWDNKEFELRDYDFLGRTFLGAGDFDLYLSENYGQDWRIPKPHFNVNVDTPNLSFAGTANALVYFSWLMANAVVENNPLRIKQYINMLVSLGAIGLDGTEAVVK